MMVDDEPTTLAVIRSFLKEDGYEDFILVDDASQALEVLKEQRPDLLLLDLMMPAVSGFDILKAVRGSRKFQHLMKNIHLDLFLHKGHQKCSDLQL